MSTGRHIDWKLVFHANVVHAGQRFTCAVELRHPFKGFFLVFSKPEAFSISALSMGVVNQLVAGHDVPAADLHRQTLILPVCMRGQRVTMEVLNTTLEMTEFHAELHGKILVGTEEDTPVPTFFERPVVDDSKVN